MYMLCKHPSMQARLRQEVRANLPPLDDDIPVTSEMLDKCHYLQAVCNEVLRFYAPLPLTLREAARDTSILGQYVPKGTTILIAVWAINQSTALWSDAGEFNPDRWMGPGKANSGGAGSAYSFMTFLHGPRSCIGQQFAKAEFASLLAAVAGRFEFELEDKDVKIDIKTGITARPKDGLNVILRPVDGW